MFWTNSFEVMAECEVEQLDLSVPVLPFPTPKIIVAEPPPPLPGDSIFNISCAVVVMLVQNEAAACSIADTNRIHL